jgi:hypothetical protein
MKYIASYLSPSFLILTLSILALAQPGGGLRGTIVPKMARSDGVGGGQVNLAQPSRAEIINEVARQTVLTNDAVSLIAKESPQKGAVADMRRQLGR